MELAAQNQQAFHLAGIIPVAGSIGEFNLPGHDVLMPVAPDFSLIEAAVAECSYAGCESIWIVCNDDIAPLIKHKVGDWVEDLYTIEKGHYVRYPKENHVSIPIYYVPIHPKHRDKYDCYAWSILHGANVAYWICRRLGRWVMPDRYYVSFPFGIYDPQEVKKAKSKLSTRAPYYFSYEGKTVCDGVPLGFTFDASEWRRARDVIKSNSRTYYPPLEGERMPSRKVPPEERRKSRHFKLLDVFKDADLSGAIINELPWFYDLTTWAQYGKLITSGHCEEIKRPYGFVTGHISIGENDSE
jgi:hypothetical protein|tara:strand:- start:2605 stop:3501 length:897 start_codon:yes stop_codon:yes gene_type:complete